MNVHWALVYCAHVLEFSFDVISIFLPSVFIDATKMNRTEKRVQFKDAAVAFDNNNNKNTKKRKKKKQRSNCSSLSAIFGLAASSLLCCLWDSVDVPWDCCLLAVVHSFFLCACVCVYASWTQSKESFNLRYKLPAAALSRSVDSSATLLPPVSPQGTTMTTQVAQQATTWWTLHTDNVLVACYSTILYASL